MTDTERRAALTAAAIIGGLGALAWLLSPGKARRKRRRSNPWRTIAKKRRVFLDHDGRLARGLPDTFRGVHVHDVSPLSRGIRQARREGEACVATVSRKLPETFPTKAAGVKALLDANPQLRDFLQSETTWSDKAFSDWLRGGRRGPKPTGYGEQGMLDAVNERLNLRGKRRVETWTEALYRLTPNSRRWADFAGSVPVLEEATGFPINLPEPAERKARQDLDVEQCRSGAEDAVYELQTQAREGRLSGGEAVPF